LKVLIFNFYFCKVQIPMANWILFLCLYFGFCDVVVASSSISLYNKLSS
jgi:hypothetical protein